MQSIPRAPLLIPLGLHYDRLTISPLNSLFFQMPSREKHRLARAELTCSLRVLMHTGHRRRPYSYHRVLAEAEASVERVRVAFSTDLVIAEVVPELSCDIGTRD